MAAPDQFLTKLRCALLQGFLGYRFIGDLFRNRQGDKEPINKSHSLELSCITPYRITGQEVDGIVFDSQLQTGEQTYDKDGENKKPAPKYCDLVHRKNSE